MGFTLAHLQGTSMLTGYWLKGSYSPYFPVCSLLSHQNKDITHSLPKFKKERKTTTLLSLDLWFCFMCDFLEKRFLFLLSPCLPQVWCDLNQLLLHFIFCLILSCCFSSLTAAAVHSSQSESIREDLPVLQRLCQAAILQKPMRNTELSFA